MLEECVFVCKLNADLCSYKHEPVPTCSTLVVLLVGILF